MVHDALTSQLYDHSLQLGAASINLYEKPSAASIETGRKTEKFQPPW
jgi:hypothetical protein